MTLSTILGGGGIAVSALFGVGSVYLALRKAKYPASLSFVHEQVIGLFDDVASKLPNLSITYKNKQIETNVILIIGYITNDGSKDISASMVERKLTATLPSSWKWLECKVLSKPEELEVSTSIGSSSDLVFDFGLFRREESFSFQALISVDEVNPKRKLKDLINEIEWNHRISDLGKVKSIDVPFEKRPPRKVLLPVIFGLAYIVGGIFMVSTDTFVKPIINYGIPVNGKYEEAKFTPKLDGTVEIESLDSEFKSEEVLADYFSTTKVHPIITKKPNSIWGKVASSAVFFIGGFFMILLGAGREIKRWRFRKIIEISNKPNNQINRTENTSVQN